MRDIRLCWMNGAAEHAKIALKTSMISIGKICERNPSSSLLKGISLQPAWEFSRLFFLIRFRKQKALPEATLASSISSQRCWHWRFLVFLARANDAPKGDLYKMGPKPSYEWSCNFYPYKWPEKRVSRFFSLLFSWRYFIPTYEWCFWDPLRGKSIN